MNAALATPGDADDSSALIEVAERAEARRIAMVARVSPAVVCIFDESQMGGGSGVIIDPRGYGLTNYHVVQPMLEKRAGWGGLSDGKLYELKVLGIDPGGDVAMFQLLGRDDFPFARMGDSDRVQPGDTAIAMGNPFVLSDDYAPTVTWGIVSGVHRYQKGSGDRLLYSDCIQVDTPINPGNSGGPLFNADGEVIGINGRISVSLRGRYNVGLGYAITVNQIKPFIPSLQAGMLTPHGTLQCVVQDHPSMGVICTELLADAPAFLAGVRPGDKILRFLDKDVTSANHYASLLGTLPANWPVPISFAKPSGENVHSIVRTEPIKSGHGPDGYPTDPDVNRAQVRRVVSAFRSTVLRDLTPPTPDNLWRWTQRIVEQGSDGAERVYQVSDDGGDRLIFGDAESGDPLYEIRATEAIDVRTGQPVATEQTLVMTAIFALQRQVLLAPLDDETVDDEWDGVRHVGADRLLAIDDAGDVTMSRLLEVIKFELGDHKVGRFQFDAETHELARIIARDKSTNETVNIYLTDRIVDQPAGESASIWRIARDDLAIGDSKDAGDVTAPGDNDGRRPKIADRLIEMLNERVVRLIGAKAGLAKGYGSGIIVSPEGHVLTVDSIVLDSSNIRGYLSDGALVSADVVYSDRSLQLALLRITETMSGFDVDTNGERTYPYFDLNTEANVERGAWVLAGGNPFKVAAGAEAISIALGVFGGRAALDATRLTRDFPYRGDVLLVDAITSTPGFPGGALVDLDGNFLGMTGRVVQSRATNTNLNHAYPAEVLRAFYETAIDPEKRLTQAEAIAVTPVRHGMKFFELGYRSNPVYVDRVRRGSPARRAGVRKDDLIVQANGRAVPNLESLNRIIEACKPGDDLQLIIMRGDDVKQVTIKLEAETP